MRLTWLGRWGRDVEVEKRCSCPPSVADIVASGLPLHLDIDPFCGFVCLLRDRCLVPWWRQRRPSSAFRSVVGGEGGGSGGDRGTLAPSCAFCSEECGFSLEV